MATHYTTLGVAPDATTTEIRRAYHAAARRWHPDQFAGKAASETRQAEARMRKLNEAWEVLGDTSRRKRYDAELASVVGRATTVGEAMQRDGSVTRIDPRLLDPQFVAARRRMVEEETDVRHSGLVRVIIVLGFFGLLAGIFVFTAYAQTRGGTPPPATAPGPDIGVEANACVRQMSDGNLLTVPCGGTSDGRVIGARLPDGSCPALTVREVLLPNEIVACLGAP